MLFLKIKKAKVPATVGILFFVVMVDGCSSYVPRNGDIIFQTSKSSQSKAIQMATHSSYSHMGIVYVNASQAYVFEAAGTVKLTELHSWIKRGIDGKYVVKRLKNADTILTSEKLKMMKNIGHAFEGKPYDLYFAWTDERIYCSELVWKIYNQALGIEVGHLQKLREFDLSNDLVQSKLRERYGNNVPLHEKVISPESMFRSQHLVTVYKN